MSDMMVQIIVGVLVAMFTALITWLLTTLATLRKEDKRFANMEVWKSNTEKDIKFILNWIKDHEKFATEQSRMIAESLNSLRTLPEVIIDIKDALKEMKAGLDTLDSRIDASERMVSNHDIQIKHLEEGQKNG